MGAYLIPSLPFGLEAVREVTLREINFGFKDSFGHKVTIADEEKGEAGFQVCPSCGVVKDPRQNEEGTRLQHSRTCTAVRKSKSQNSEVPWLNLYLYREMQSEALRILLPVSTILVSEKLATFQACLDLGLRRMFQGDPDHLQIGQAVEVSPDGTRRRYLLIYDSVPGGTSYLRDLVRPEKFRELLQLARETLISCRCRLDPNKQACYRCLYSYNTQYDKDLISRRLGVEMLEEILAQWPEMQPNSSLSGTDMVSLLESELEQRFVDALAARAAKLPELHWQMVLHRGKQAYRLTVGEKKWLVEPQVYIGSEYGVAPGSKPDFVFWPQGQGAVKPVAIFTDGFAYHVQPELAESRLPDDLQKRRALLASQAFQVWSLTWDDVMEFTEETMFPLAFWNSQQRKQLGGMLPKGNMASLETAVHENGVQQLLRYLAHPDDDAWSKLGVMASLILMMPPRPPVAEVVLVELEQRLRQMKERPLLTIPANAPSGSHLYGIVESGHNQFLIQADQMGLQTADASALSVTLRLDDKQSNRAADGFKDDWRQFLLLLNVFQFLPGFVPVMSAWLDMPTSSESEEVEGSKDIGTISDATEIAWMEAAEYILPETEELLKQVKSLAVRPPLFGYEIVGDDGKVGSMAELVWEAEKTAVFLDDQQQDKITFQQAGWQVFDIFEETAILNHLQASMP
ncbi:MAG: DUF1998 domain-containing protein [Ardenticatenaceae bacterium]|nr:DUF1998 domain-containing protein [Ardenticatenaceae bacterium]